MPDVKDCRAFTSRRPAARVCALLVAPLACVLCLSAQARAQVVVEDDGEAPPPLKYVTPSERALLDAARDAKARTRLSLELAESRLSRATQLAAAGRFEQATCELGIYQALVADAVGRLRALGRNDDRTLDLLKRVELTLRAHAPRVETVRRMTPSEQAVHVRAAYEFVRRARAEALEGFYGGTVAQAEEISPRQQAAPPPFSESFARLHAAYDLLSNRVKAREAVPVLVELLADEEALVRSNAARGLGALGAEAQSAVPALIQTLKDRNALVRYSAAEAIHKIGRAAVPALDKALQGSQ